jgi:hypothetical protein
MARRSEELNVAGQETSAFDFAFHTYLTGEYLEKIRGGMNVQGCSQQRGCCCTDMGQRREHARQLWKPRACSVLVTVLTPQPWEERIHQLSGVVFYERGVSSKNFSDAGDQELFLRTPALN